MPDVVQTACRTYNIPVASRNVLVLINGLTASFAISGKDLNGDASTFWLTCNAPRRLEESPSICIPCDRILLLTQEGAFSETQ